MLLDLGSRRLSYPRRVCVGRSDQVGVGAEGGTEVLTPRQLHAVVKGRQHRQWRPYPTPSLLPQLQGPRPLPEERESISATSI